MEQRTQDDRCRSPVVETTGASRTNADAIKNFFPATREGFVAKCGSVAAVRLSDFEDEHRRRHLESFKSSWEEWMRYHETAADGTETSEEIALLLVKQLMDLAPTTQAEFDTALRQLRREHKTVLSKHQMLSAYETLRAQGGAEQQPLDQFLVKKIVRTHSGVVVITVLTSPGSFSCPKDCYYCPNEPGQPRSYLSTEPAVLRANQCGWDAAVQFWDRALTLYNNGHTIDKIEVLVLGGTWSGYPKGYQEEFVRDLFYAANVFHDVLRLHGEERSAFFEVAGPGEFPVLKVPDGLRDRLSLETEQKMNEDSDCRVIGLTLETRPDHISLGELRRLRRFGCTRVQIGIQHTKDAILKHINRGCTLRDAVRAVRLLKDACFKVDIHLMPDLPGSSPFDDRDMFEFVLSSPWLQTDQWKIYPCEVTPFSVIERWYKEGTFVPYAERHEGRELVELLLKVKSAVHPWIRLNRVVRDIPNPSIIAGNDITNLRQVLLSTMKECGLRCRCLRCREVKTLIVDQQEAILKVRCYSSYGGQDYFLSYESPDETRLFGFLRLRFRDDDIGCVSTKEYPQLRAEEFCLSNTFPELDRSGLIRELHVYGQLVGSKEQKLKNDNRSQHTGFGRRLLLAAEVITLAKGLRKLAVIAGVGTRHYYRKFGYEIENWFMTKHLSADVKNRAAVLDLALPLAIEMYDVTTDLGLSSVTEQLDAGVVVIRKKGERRKPPKSKEEKERLREAFAAKVISRPAHLHYVSVDEASLFQKQPLFSIIRRYTVVHRVVFASVLALALWGLRRWRR